jgi:polygalacturonase
VVDNVNITTDRGGLYLSQCRNVMVSNCHIDAVRREGGRPAGGGNAIILGSDLSLDESRPSENITIRNCFLESGSGALQLGADTIGAYRNIRCENIRIFRPGKAGISASSNDGD